MSLELKQKSYGICMCEEENKLYLSGKKNREIDIVSGKQTALFGTISSINPKLSFSERYISLPSTYDGIEVIDRKVNNKTVFRYSAYANHTEMIPYCAWHKMNDILVFSTKKEILVINIEHEENPRVLFDLNDFGSVESGKANNHIAFIKSFDVVGNDVYTIVYRSPDPCIIVKTNLFDGTSQIINDSKPVDCPNSIISDGRDGYYLLRWGKGISHCLADSSEEEHIPEIEAGVSMAVSDNGLLLSVNHYPTKKAVCIYNTKSRRLISEISTDYQVISMAFSTLNHYILLSGEKSLVIKCNDEAKC